MAEKEAETLSSAPKEKVYSTNLQREDNSNVESSVNTPGFESLLGALGIIIAFRLKARHE